MSNIHIYIIFINIYIKNNIIATIYNCYLQEKKMSEAKWQFPFSVMIKHAHIISYKIIQLINTGI